MIKYFFKVSYILGNEKKQLVILAVGAVIASVLEIFGIGLIGPFIWIVSRPESIIQVPLLSWVYKAMGEPSPENFTLILGVFLVFIFCIRSYLSFQIRSSIYRFSYEQQARVASQLLSTYLSVPYSFHLSRDSASLATNILIEAQNFCYKCILPVLDAFSNTVTIISLLLLLAKASLVLLVMISAVILPVILVFHFYKGKAQSWGREAADSYHELLRTINHALGGLKETYVIGCKDYFIGYAIASADRNVNSLVKSSIFQTLPKIALETLLIVLVVLVIAVYQIFFGEDFQKLVSVLAVFTVSSVRLLPSVNQVIVSIGLIQVGIPSLDMLYHDLKVVENSFIIPTVDSNYQADQVNVEQLPPEVMKFSSEIKLQDIMYRYTAAAKPSLEKISFTVYKGESIALIGKSGAGKTTLIDVLLGLLQPESGDIHVDGVSIYKDIRAWQSLVGYIPQVIFLTDDSIARNIAFGVPDELIDYEKLEKAIDAVQLKELIQQLPDGVQTSVGERGVRLSGGQRQRIGIARALYHDREILVLDEATAALDNETEKLVTEAIQSLSGSKTLIIIAHRLTTVKDCDRVYQLEDGRILRSGSYEEIVGLHSLHY